MTKAIKATATGLKPHFKVRVVIPGALLHLASWTEPKILGSEATDVIDWIDASWISDPAYGDTLGFIDWSLVKAVTYRWSE